MLALGEARIAIRRLELRVSPLESMFFALTSDDARARANSSRTSSPSGCSRAHDRPSPAPVSGPTRERSPPRASATSTSTELQKLRAQLTTRLLALLAVLGPFAFAVLLKVQSGTPADALFGAWVHTSGFAVSLVIARLRGHVGIPDHRRRARRRPVRLEDRYGTWKTILTRSCSREDVFVGKVLAVGTLVGRR